MLDEAHAVLAWHWLADDRRLAHTIPPVIVETGKTYQVDGPLELCTRGLHGSRRPLDALQFASGAVVCRTAHWGAVLEGPDKLCSQYRRVLWMADATHVLHTFACDVAEAALLRERTAGREPDQRCWAAIEAKRAWLRGEMSDGQLDAAWDAARDAAGDAASAAASAAARGAAWDAAWAAAWAAARAAAGAAAEAVAWNAAQSDQNALLERYLLSLTREVGHE